MVSLLDEVVFHGISEGVDHLVDNVAWIDEADDTGLLGGPEVLPTAAEGVLTFGEQLMKVFEERRVVAVRVLDAPMVMVAQGRGENDADPVSMGCDGQAVDEGVVGLAVWPHEKLPLRTAASNHVRPTRKDFARNRHGWLSELPPPSCERINLGEVMEWECDVEVIQTDSDCLVGGHFSHNESRCRSVQQRLETWFVSGKSKSTRCTHATLSEVL